MPQFLGFGNGSDGEIELSGTDTPIDSSCSGSSGSNSLTATNGDFEAGQIILISQTRGTGTGAWEINKIASYSAGTITTLFDLENDYTDSGASQAQVLVLKQYSNVSGSIVPKAWDENVGGIFGVLCSGKVLIDGAFNGNGVGFLGGPAQHTGESQLAANSSSSGADPDDANGGAGQAGRQQADGGGGASYGTSGTSGGGTGTGAAGITYGDATLSELHLGSGGGGGGGINNGGGKGGAAIAIFASEIEITGSLTSNGNDGGTTTQSNSGGSGGGSGGSILLKARKITLGTNLVTALGGSGAAGLGSGNTGGNGGNGRIRIEACSINGVSNPSASEDEGGQDFCGSFIGAFE